MACRCPEGKMLKNLYIQDHTTGTTFEPKNLKKNVTKKENDHDWTLNIMNKQATVNRYKHTNRCRIVMILRLKATPLEYYFIGYEKSYSDIL